MEDIIASIATAASGMTADEVTSALEQCPNVPPEKVATLSAWIVSIADA